MGEARAAGTAVDTVYLDAEAAGGRERALARAAAADGATVVELQPGVLARIADTVTPQPVAATVRSVDVGLAELARRQPSFVVVCAEVRDPGNLGTIVRSAAAAGVGGIICCAGSVDVYNPKTVRASAGMLFHLPVVAGPDAKEVLDELGQWGLRRWGTAATGGRVYTEADLTGPVALVFGNEARGLDRAFAAHLDGSLTIPMAAGAESLNVAAAATVLCFETDRQRRAGSA